MIDCVTHTCEPVNNIRSLCETVGLDLKCMKALTGLSNMVKVRKQCKKKLDKLDEQPAGTYKSTGRLTL